MAGSISAKRLSIFLSYASEHTPLAERIYFRLQGSGHRVFFDHACLPPGREFDRAIRDQVRSSDLMVFLISPESVADGAYARTELKYARDRWPVSDGRVLPVMVEETEFRLIPEYLKAVTILRPEGDVAAEIAAAVANVASDQGPGWAVDELGRQLESTLARFPLDNLLARFPFEPGDAIPVLFGFGVSFLWFVLDLIPKWIGFIPAVLGVLITLLSIVTGLSDMVLGYKDEKAKHQRSRSALRPKEAERHTLLRDLPDSGRDRRTAPSQGWSTTSER